MSIHFLSRTGIETEVNITVGVCLGLTWVMDFIEAMSFFLICIDSVTYLSTVFTILNRETILSPNRNGVWTSILCRSSWYQTFMFKTGPILVFLRIHPLIWVSFSFRSIVYSRHECYICCPSSVSRVQKCCPCSTSFKSALEHSLDNFWPSDNCSIFRSYSCIRIFRYCALVLVLHQKRGEESPSFPNGQKLFFLGVLRSWTIRCIHLILRRRHCADLQNSSYGEVTRCFHRYRWSVYRLLSSFFAS